MQITNLPMSEQLWFTKSREYILKTLNTDEDIGLSKKEVQKRFKQAGPNSLPAKQSLSSLKLFLNQFHNILIYILISAAIISFLLGEKVDASIISIAIIINVIVGYIQEYKAQTALANLSKVIKYYTIVIRDGIKQKISVDQLVQGDIVILKAGSNIPADCRLIESNDFEVNEASLTGESAPINKFVSIITKKDEDLGERFNMAYMGTLATRGRAVAIVVEVGISTEIGKIAELLRDTAEEQTPLQKKLDQFSKKLGALILIASFIIFGIGVFFGKPVIEMFTVAVATAVSAIPEGLVIAVTVILAIGMQRILKKEALVRKLAAAETLGSTDVVCSDKTGTLTEGKMMVKDLFTATEVYPMNAKVNLSDDISQLLICGMLANDTILENPDASYKNLKYIGSPTEVALYNAAYTSGLKKSELLLSQPRIDFNSFNSTRKYVMALHNVSKTHNIIYINGAPERLLQMSKSILINGKEQSLSSVHKRDLMNRHGKYTSRGMRLVGSAYIKVNAGINSLDDFVPSGIVFLGMFVIEDPVRKGVRETITIARSAGIKTVMITGDHKNTAQSIAAELGLDDGDVLEGTELSKMSDIQLAKLVNTVSVFARVSPHDKLRIVDAFQANGHIVAMTGDGINDAPALKSADIGIAVGSGTDVTKGVADMVLLDNNFKTIIAAIKQGRIIVDNIKKVIVYLLADSFSEMILVLGSLFFGLPLPITAAQILWINLVTDGFPYMALTLERGESDVMKLAPVKKTRSILDKEMKALIFIIGVITDIVLLSLFLYYFNSTGDLGHARTIIFAALGLDSLLYVFSCKSLRKPIWQINIFDNKYLIWAVIIGIGIQLCALYIPFLRSILSLEMLYLIDWAIIIPLALLKIIGIEITKYYFIHKKSA